MFNITLHQKQAEVINHPARFKVVCAGRRWGKSYLSMYSLVEESTRSPKRKVWYVAPSYRMAKQIMWQELIDNVPRQWVRRLHHTELSITLVNGSVIECKGADNPDSLRGVGLHYLVMDEFQDFKEGVWEKVLRPTLAKDRSPALIIGTPKGFSNLYDLYKLGKDEGNSQWKSWQFETITSPFIPEQELLDAKRDMDPISYRQEFCHLPQTEILMSDGAKTAIASVKIGDTVAFEDGGQLKSCTVTDWRYTGTKPIMTVTLENGETFSASHGHKVKIHGEKVALSQAKSLEVVFCDNRVLSDAESQAADAARPKKGQKQCVPEWIISGSREVKIAYLASLWGTGDSAVLERDASPRMPSVILRIDSAFSDGALIYLSQIDTLMSDVGVSVEIFAERIMLRNQDQIVHGLRIVSDVNNLIAFFEIVGFIDAREKSFLAFLWLNYLKSLKHQLDDAFPSFRSWIGERIS